MIAALAFRGPQLEEAKIGVLTAAVWSALATCLVVLATSRFPEPLRARALLGRSEVIVDLTEPVDPGRDHIRGPAGAPVTLVEYGDFECPYCGQAEPVVREPPAGFGDLRYVWRHLPLSDVHPRAQLAAEASEAAGAYDIGTLSRAVRTARARAAIRTPQPEPARQPARWSLTTDRTFLVHLYHRHGSLA